ncbi:hypothetical protein LTR29_001167 [Friedmanniomyces endolithicus]|uniref:SAP domain-containing protein n=1 Tax=Rachicladosporium monterosium TaxID=1507873 RepID=A0ABR0L2A7_9PEZI|nr:hypothetical protein LTR29_001167 [Friedmanniomyces endolithicus]KAK5141442.1 hypothetical protein LTR32_005999 [Rachicladosporium monterosium]
MASQTIYHLYCSQHIAPPRSTLHYRTTRTSKADHGNATPFCATILKAFCKERNIRTNGAMKRELIRRLQKYATQAIVYDGRPKRDLVKEAKAREIDCSQTKTSTDVIALLESADRSRTFHPFLDLPAELRNMVYRHAVVVDDPLWSPGSRARTPAICRASKQLREESKVVVGHVKVAGQRRARKAWRLAWGNVGGCERVGRGDGA